MKCIGLDGKVYTLNFKKLSKNVSSASALHESARALLKSIFPLASVYEEVLLPSTKLYADFFVSDMKMIIEVHGQQHYQFVKFFHKSEAEFKLSLARDATKQEWCEINDIAYVPLPFDKIPDWKDIIYEHL